MHNFRNRSFVEALMWFLAFAVIAGAAITMNAHEALDAIFASHEDHQLDEIFTAFAVAGILGLIYSILRLKDLAAEAKRRRLAERNADHATSHDGLTGLPNRRMLDAEVSSFEATNAASKLYTAFCIDLDGLKRVNDEYGDACGNAVLKAVATRLSQVRSDANTFHVGGDRFVVLSSCNCSAPNIHAEQILAAVCQPIKIADVTIELAVSIGYATLPEDASDLKSLIRCAEGAMYIAKKRGPNVATAFTASIDDARRVRAQIEADLKAAIRDDVIVPYYQPLVDIKSGKIVGYEALARWERRPGQFVPPSDFIPLAEETGLISSLTDSLFLQACRDAVTWPSEIILAFNISAAQLGDQSLGLRLIKILDQTRLPTHRVELEVTESAFIHDSKGAQNVLGGLVQAGLKIAIDDFGTGYSSLSQLSTYPFHKLKIDRSFVQSFETCEKQDKIVNAIIALAKSLGMKITGEGIEHESQRVKLEAIGCDFGQGYWFGRPMPAASLISPDLQMTHAQQQTKIGDAA
ncbi:putative bifunctional diguanylate cyclase/phosphodiesterase [Agrobacterium tumefaciens]|nr:hypothetical protein BV900_27325 [Agrobacterium tumefaciens]